MSFWKWSQTAASNSNADGSINWAEGQAPSSVNDSARGMMAAAAKYRDDTSGTLTTAGTSTAYTVTTSQSFDTLAHLAGAKLIIVPHVTSGASPTLNVDGLGAKAINVSTGVAVSTGVLLAGTPYAVTYSNANSEFVLIGGIGAGTIGTTQLAAAAVTLAKIVNVAASRLLGNPTGGATTASEISLGAGLAFSGTTVKLSTTTPTYQVLTSGTTYTTPANVTWIKVRAIAGGGGGGGSSTSGGAGGTTTFNSVNAVGGSLGTSTSSAASGAGGAGGTGGTGTATLRIAGGNGGTGPSVASANTAPGGTGGAGAFGGGGASGVAQVANIGCGGGGGLSAAGTGGSGGGGAGEYFELIIGSPAASYTYAIGAAGAAGTGGTSPQAGSAGRIVVEEYYN